jgi:hypothetical protein
MTERARFDRPWKRILDRCFREFLELVLPDEARGIAWDLGYEMLDKELEALAGADEVQDRAADALIKVPLEAGGDVWVLVHVEVQMQPDRSLAERIYTYNYRAFDRHRRRVASIAVLGDDRRDWRPSEFSYELFATEVRLRFPVVKLLDFEMRRPELEASRNPFSRVILAQLTALRTRGRPRERLRSKRHLLRDLLAQGYPRALIIEVFRFLDLVLALPKPLDDEFRESVKRETEEFPMPWLSTFEREAMEQGMQQGMQNAILKVLIRRFGPAAEALTARLRAVADREALEGLASEAASVPSLEAFARELPGPEPG